MELNFLSFPALLTFILFFITALKLKTVSKYSSQNLPPGPPKIPFLGNIHNLVGSLPHRKLRDLAQKYGSLMHLKLGELSVMEVMEIASGFCLADIFPSLTWLHVMSGERQRMGKAHEKIDKMLEDIIGAHKASRVRKEKSDGEEEEEEEEEGEEDLVNVLLRVQEQDALAFPLTTENVKAIVMTIILRHGLANTVPDLHRKAACEEYARINARKCDFRQYE
ncbi:hypothetical protein RJ641_034723 [Dillenia turbinata]|uniref:Uncharacterized protein n=1 Tax=Dillenia turbinata TaxID=194707 RepID=A0AAN8VGD7_9MAGN